MTSVSDVPLSLIFVFSVAATIPYKVSLSREQDVFSQVVSTTVALSN